MSRRHRIAPGQLTLGLQLEIPCDAEKIEAHPDGSVERWRPVVGWRGYDVSDRGRVRSWFKLGGHEMWRFGDRPRLLVLSKNRQRVHVTLKNGERRTSPSVHKLVLEAFIGPRPERWLCRHLDGNPHNNRLENIKWGTSVENADDMTRHGTRKERKPRQPVMFFDSFLPLESLVPWEVWKEPPGHEGYEVSNRGNIRSYRKIGSMGGLNDTPRPIKPVAMKKGHLLCGLRRTDGRHRKWLVHRLVLTTFSPQSDETLICRHLDGNPARNDLSNLRWGTIAENNADMAFHGTAARGELSRFAKLTEGQVREIRRRAAAGERQCDLAREFNVWPMTISVIRRNLAWRHVV